MSAAKELADGFMEDHLQTITFENTILKLGLISLYAKFSHNDEVMEAIRLLFGEIVELETNSP